MKTWTLLVMYLTYLQENFKPVVYRSASVEVFDEEDAQVVHPGPSYWGCQGTWSRRRDGCRGPCHHQHETNFIFGKSGKTIKN